MYFYKDDNNVYDADYIVTLVNGTSISRGDRIGVYEYDEDSKLKIFKAYSSQNNTTYLYWFSNFTYLTVGNRIIRTERDSFNSDSSFREVTNEGGITKSEFSYNNSIDISGGGSRKTISYHTYNSDTIIDYDYDSIPQDFANSLQIHVDSAVTITKFWGYNTVVTRFYFVFYKLYGGEFFSNGLSVSIDTIFKDGSSRSYLMDTESGLYFLISKSVKRNNGNTIVSYEYKNGAWLPRYKIEHYYLAENQNCLSAAYSHRWLNNTWQLEFEYINYFDGQTNTRKVVNTIPCKLTNPFTHSLPFSCEALFQDEKYTLTVDDLTGAKLFEKDFYLDQTINELATLKSEQLYYFIITDSQSAIVSKLKILMY